jgi:broad specificity phosphatase PhoE
VLVHLIRHAARAGGYSEPGDPGISAAGIVQAQQTATWLQSTSVRMVYTSPLQRALETASIMAEMLRLPVRTDVRLRERANWGDIPGQTRQEFGAVWDRCSRERDWCPPGGTSARQAGQRLEAFLLDCRTQWADGAIAAVSHGGIIADFLRNQFPAAVLEGQNPRVQHMANCAITTLRHDGHTFELVRVGSSLHLHT